MSGLKEIKVLTTCAMLLALAIILGMFKIPINSIIEIRFGSIPIAIAGSLFGPAVGAIVGGAADIVQFVVKPTGPYFPGFTISSMATGVIFGYILRAKSGKVSLVRVVIAELIYSVIVCLGINTLNLYILYGNMASGGAAGYFAFMLTRLPKEIVMFPINCLIMATIINHVHMIGNKVFINN
ncbi:MAG: folate family ECF transporter S component [Pseudobutyrivibrio sp.]|nr:folate family ECF transporter S component [Pseudobutyrivibrio sp.]